MTEINQLPTPEKMVDESRRPPESADLKGKRIVLTTFGSFGDLHPYIAVGLELKARGHHPVIATSSFYAEKVKAAGLGIYFHARVISALRCRRFLSGEHRRHPVFETACGAAHRR